MLREHIWHAIRRRDSPNQLKEGEQKQRFGDSEKERRHHVAGPMRAQVNSRISNRQSDKPVQPAAATVKQSKIRRDNCVVYSVPRWKRWSRAGPVGRIRKPNGRFLEQRQEFRTRFLQLHHPHGLHLFRPVTGHSRF